MKLVDLVARLAERASITKKKAREILVFTFASIAEDAKAGGRVHMPGFGVFQHRRRVGRRILNPVTGEAMRIPADTRLSFRASEHQRFKVKR